MKIITGSAAYTAFEDLLKAIKPNPMHFCTLVLQESGSQSVMAWQKDPQKIKILTGLMEQALAAESNKATFLVMPSGSIFVFLDHTTQVAYKKAHQCLLSTTAELVDTSHDVKIGAYDLSVDWDAFFAICKTEYQQNKQVNQPNRQEFIQRLHTQMGAAVQKCRERPSHRKGLNLLFVEDDASTRQLLNSLLAEHGFGLRFASNADDAVREYASKPPHIVFLDINLPDVTGLELLEILSRYDPNAYPVMLTSSADMAGVEFARKHGVKGYIVKPFSLQKVQECLDRYTSTVKA